VSEVLLSISISKLLSSLRQSFKVLLWIYFFCGIVAITLLWFVSTIPTGPAIICTDTPQEVCNEWYSEQDFWGLVSAKDNKIYALVAIYTNLFICSIPLVCLNPRRRDKSIYCSSYWGIPGMYGYFRLLL